MLQRKEWRKPCIEGVFRSGKKAWVRYWLIVVGKGPGSTLVLTFFPDFFSCWAFSHWKLRPSVYSPISFCGCIRDTQVLSHWSSRLWTYGKWVGGNLVHTRPPWTFWLAVESLLLSADLGTYEGGACLVSVHSLFVRVTGHPGCKAYSRDVTTSVPALLGWM